MKNFSLSFVSDLIFTAFSTFILSFVLINYFLPRIPTIIFSLTLSLIFSTIFYQKRSKKTRAERIKKTDRKNLERTVLELNFMSEKNALSLFKKAFENKNIKVEMRKDHLFLPERDTLVFIKCDLDGATKKDVVKAFNLLNENRAEIYTTTDDIDLVSFANRFDGKIKILDSHKIYKLLKDCDLLPVPTIPDIPKPKNRELIKMTFSKKKAKNYFFLGLGFLFMSYFVSFKLYYVLFGTGFMIFSLVCRFFAPTEN